MKKLAILMSLALASVFAHAQTATFTFGAVLASNGECTEVTSWNGVTDAYPEDMGSICFNLGEYPYSGMEIPWQLGFPNNGFLLDQTPFTYSAPFNVVGGLHTNGGTFQETGVAAYAGYGQGVTVSVLLNFSVTVTKWCRFGRCNYLTTYNVTGGSGVVTYQH